MPAQPSGSGSATVLPSVPPSSMPSGDEWDPPLTGPARPRPPPPSEESAPLPTFAEAVGCTPGSPSPRPAELASGCHAASPFYEGTVADCSQRWCERPAPPIVASCTPLVVSFAGGYHYLAQSADFEVDVFFLPVPGPNDPTPDRENFGWLSLHVELGETHLGVPVGTTLYLSASEAFAAGLDVIDGTLRGDLVLAGIEGRVEGPLYQPGCESVIDEVGRELPGECACRFASVVPSIRIYLPLGPLDGWAPGPIEQPSPDGVRAADAGAGSEPPPLP
jgi:hypothetical protein